MDYVGVKCSICEKIFDENDDIVVCPQCGTPFHRECYKTLGHCPNLENHGDKEKDWSDPRKKDHDMDDELHENFVICPRCFHKNPKGTLFCTVCGRTLGNQNSSKNNFDGLKGFEEQAIQLLMDPLGGIDPSEDFDGIKAEELCEFVGSNTQYYIREFKKIKDSGKCSFNFAACCSPAGWMLYRKQYFFGAIMAGILVLLTFFSGFIHYNNSGFLDQIYADLGLQNKLFFTISDHLSVWSSVLSLPFETSSMYLLSIVLKFVFLIVGVIIGMRANKIYMKFCINSIKKIKADSSLNEDRSKAFRKFGGVNTSLLLCVILLLIVYELILF